MYMGNLSLRKMISLLILIEKTKGSGRRPRIRSKIYGKLCRFFLAAAMTLLSGSSSWASQNEPNNDFCECQVLLSDFDSNEPLISPLLFEAWWEEGTDENNVGTMSVLSVDCNDGECDTPCSLKWTYETKGQGSSAYMRLRVSGPRWMIPMDMSRYGAISFHIKGMETFAGSIKFKLWAAKSEGGWVNKEKELTQSDISPEWKKVEISIKDNPNLTSLDLRSTHSIEFVDDNQEIVSNTIWIDQVCLIPDPNSTQDDITIENDKVAFKLTPGHGSLFSVCDKDTGTELLSAGPTEGRLLYSLAYMSDANELCWSNNCLAEEFSYDIDTNGSRFSGRWVHKWDTSEAKVLLTAVLPTGSSLATWTIDVNVTGDAILDSLEFPVLKGVGKIGSSGEDDRLIYPCMGGRLYVNPIEKLKNQSLSAFRYPSGLASMQLMGYYDNHTGFFVSSLDTRGLSKFPTWAPEGEDWATIKFTHDALSAIGNDKSFEMAARLGVFHGDWTTAASIYRNWAQQQWWAEDIVKKDTPDWLTRIGIAQQYYVYQNEEKTYDDWAQKIAEHNDYFQVPILAHIRGWERGGQWASGDYFPPKNDPNWISFDCAIDRVRQSGGYPYPFISARSVRVESPTWDEGGVQRAAMVNVNDEPISIPGYDGYVEVLMCFESEEWISQLTDWILILARHKVGVVQLDCFPLPELKDCYSFDHLHGDHPGCGTRPYRVAENLLTIRSQLREGYENICLSSEYEGELYVPVFDMCHSRECWAEAEPGGWVFQQGLAESIPLFQFVYHANIVLLDMYSLGPWPAASLADRAYDRLAVGRAFAWGGICCYNMQGDIEEHKSLTSFLLLKKCAQARVGFLRNFLVFGQMLPPPKVDGSLMKVEVKEHWTDGPNDPLLFSGEVPSILTSAWQSERGDVAIIVLNIGEDTLNTTVPLSPYSQYVSPGASMLIYDDNELVTSRIVEEGLRQEPIELQPLHFTTFVFSSYPTGF